MNYQETEYALSEAVKALGAAADELNNLGMVALVSRVVAVSQEVNDELTFVKREREKLIELLYDALNEEASAVQIADMILVAGFRLPD
jgi:hypothetical protein